MGNQFEIKGENIRQAGSSLDVLAGAVSVSGVSLEVSSGQDVLKKYLEDYQLVIKLTERYITLLKQDIIKVNTCVGAIEIVDAGLISGEEG